MILSFFSSVSADYHKLAYDFNFKGLDGNEINLKDFNEKVIVVVNVASRCGYTPQYNDLQKLWSQYKNDLVGGDIQQKHVSFATTLSSITIVNRRDMSITPFLDYSRPDKFGYGPGACSRATLDPKINRETMITNPIIITPANTVTRSFKNFIVGATKISF